MTEAPIELAGGIAPGRLDRWLAGREGAIFAALTLLHLAPLWAFPYFPSTDGPIHLSIADVLVRYQSVETPSFRVFYEINGSIEPNSFIFGFLYLLMQAVPPLIAEKVLLSAYVVLVPLALRYAVTAAAPEAGILSLLGFPLIYTFTLHMGMYNHGFGLIFFLLVLGYWLKNSRRPSVLVFLVYLGLFLLCYLAHLFAVVLAVAAIAFAALGATALDAARQRQAGAFDAGRLWRDFAARALLPAAASLPVLLLVLAFFLRHGPGVVAHGMTMSEGLATIDWPSAARLRELLSASGLVSHDVWEMLASKGFLLALLGVAGLIAARRLPGSSTLNPAFFCLLGMLGLYFAVPDWNWLPERLMPALFMAAIVWLATQLPHALPRRRRLVRPWIVISVSVISLVGLSVRAVKYAELNGYIAEYLSAAEHVEANSTLLSLRLGREVDGAPISDRIDLFIHAAGYYAFERSVVDLKNIQAAYGAFPIIYRPALSLFRNLDPSTVPELIPPRIDLLQYARRTGLEIDYIVLWGEADRLGESADGRRLAAQLGQAYELIFTSPRRGLTRLYRIKRRKSEHRPPAASE